MILNIQSVSRLKRVIQIIIFLLLLVGCASIRIDHGGIGIVPCKEGPIPQLLDENFKLPGTLLIDVPIESRIIALNGEDHASKTIFQYPKVNSDQLSIYELSPDGKWIVLLIQDRDFTSSPPRLFLVSNSGEVVERKLDLFVPQSLKKTNRYFWMDMGWLNDKLLKVYIANDEHDHAVVFLDPFTGQWRASSFQIPDQKHGTGELIAPDFSHILYVNNQNDIALYDFQKESVLWENESKNLVFSADRNPSLKWAKWTRNGQLLVVPVSKGPERFGVEILTNVGTVFRKYENENYVVGLSWSHNLKLLANHITDQLTNDPRIDIYDTDSQILQRSCLLTGLADPLMNLRAENIVWSPDDRFLIYGFRKIDGIRNGLVLQNLYSGERRLIDLNKNIDLIGWSSLSW
jgi:hypothetical protein